MNDFDKLMLTLTTKRWNIFDTPIFHRQIVFRRQYRILIKKNTGRSLKYRTDRNPVYIVHSLQRTEISSYSRNIHFHQNHLDWTPAIFRWNEIRGVLIVFDDLPMFCRCIAPSITHTTNVHGNVLCIRYAYRIWWTFDDTKQMAIDRIKSCHLI